MIRFDFLDCFSSIQYAVLAMNSCQRITNATVNEYPSYGSECMNISRNQLVLMDYLAKNEYPL